MPWPWVSVALLLLGTGLKLIWLFAEPSASVADNGDYWRVARPAGLEHVEGARIDGTRPSQWFRVIPPAREAGLSSPVLIAAAARVLGAREGRLDIRWVGGIHVAALLVVAGLGRSVAGGWRAGGVLGLFLVVLCDAAYPPFFNSFHAEGVMLIAVVGAGIWLLADDAFGSLRWTLAGTALILLGSLTKPLYAGFGLALIATLLVGPQSRRLVRARLSLATAPACAASSCDCGCRTRSRVASERWVCRRPVVALVEGHEFGRRSNEAGGHEHLRVLTAKWRWLSLGGSVQPPGSHRSLP